jgi:hypothetical protein
MFLKTIGLIIFILGFLLTLYTGLDFIKKEKVPDLSGSQITKDIEQTTNWYPFIGIGSMIIGGVVFISSGKNHFRLSTN